MFCWKMTALLTEQQAIALVWFELHASFHPTAAKVSPCGGWHCWSPAARCISNRVMAEEVEAESFTNPNSSKSPIFLLSQLHVFAPHAHSAHHSQLAMQAITKNGTRKHEIKFLADSFMLPLATWQPLILHTVNAIF